MQIFGKMLKHHCIYDDEEALGIQQGEDDAGSMIRICLDKLGKVIHISEQGEVEVREA